MTYDDIEEELKKQVKEFIPEILHKHHNDHIDFALDLVDDISNYDDELFISYHKKIVRMRHYG